MKRNLLLEYSEELAIKIAKLCSQFLNGLKCIIKKQSQPFKFILAKKKDTLNTLRVGVYDDY